MTRYLLIPSTIDSDCSSDSALLLPTDRFNGKTIEIEIPNGILQRFDAAEHSPNKKDIYNNIIILSNMLMISLMFDDVLLVPGFGFYFLFDSYFVFILCKIIK